MQAFLEESGGMPLNLHFLKLLHEATPATNKLQGMYQQLYEIPRLLLWIINRGRLAQKYQSDNAYSPTKSPNVSNFRIWAARPGLTVLRANWSKELSSLAFREVARLLARFGLCVAVAKTRNMPEEPWSLLVLYFFFFFFAHAPEKSLAH